MNIIRMFVFFVAQAFSEAFPGCPTPAPPKMAAHSDVSCPQEGPGPRA